MSNSAEKNETDTICIHCAYLFRTWVSLLAKHIKTVTEIVICDKIPN